jgi:hypothetical protein
MLTLLLLFWLILLILLCRCCCCSFVVPKLLKSVDNSALNADKLLESVWEARALILQLADQASRPCCHCSSCSRCSCRAVVVVVSGGGWWW